MLAALIVIAGLSGYAGLAAVVIQHRREMVLRVENRSARHIKDIQKDERYGK